jgi:hypothetical protein
MSKAIPPLVFGLSIKPLFPNGGNFGTDDSEFFFCNSKRRLSLPLCLRGHATPSSTRSEIKTICVYMEIKKTKAACICRERL